LRRLDGSFPTESLSSKIAEALQKAKGDNAIGSRVALRIADVPRAEGFKRFINHQYVQNEFVFGDICLFSPGQMQALLTLTDDPEHFSLDDTMRALEIAEAKAPPGREYLNAIAYWLAIGDHFYQIQHTSLQANAMEQYLTWLLRDQSQVISRDQYVQLDCEFDRQAVGGDMNDIRSIEVGGLVPETIEPDKPSGLPQHGDRLQTVDVETHESLGQAIAARFDKGKRILAELLGEIEASKIIKEMPPDAALEVSVNIGYRATRRKFSKEFMGNIASGLRNMPDGEIRVSGKDGVLRGDDARLAADMGIKKISDSSGLLDMEHALSQMLEVHRRFLHDGRIVS